jgi:hypothetical protein
MYKGHYPYLEDGQTEGEKFKGLKCTFLEKSTGQKQEQSLYPGSGPSFRNSSFSRSQGDNRALGPQYEQSCRLLASKLEDLHATPCWLFMGCYRF